MNETYVPASGFRWLTPWYDLLVARCTREQEFKVHLLDQAQLSPGVRLLDIGCGTGTLLSLAGRRQQELHLQGVDADAHILARAQAKLAQTAASTQSCHPIKLLEASATELPGPDNNFDVVVTSLLFHHLLATEKRKCLSEVHRVLVPGGKLLLADYCLASNAVAVFRFLPVRLVDGWRRTACNAAGKLPGLISQAGFSNVRETLQLETLLGTMRCYQAFKPADASNA